MGISYILHPTPPILTMQLSGEQAKTGEMGEGRGSWLSVLALTLAVGLRFSARVAVPASVTLPRRCHSLLLLTSLSSTWGGNHTRTLWLCWCATEIVPPPSALQLRRDFAHPIAFGDCTCAHRHLASPWFPMPIAYSSPRMAATHSLNSQQRQQTAAPEFGHMPPSTAAPYLQPPTTRNLTLRGNRLFHV